MSISNPTRFPYSRFEGFCIRTPIFPLDFFYELTSNTKLKDSVLHSHFSNPIVNEAMFLASPYFYEVIAKWIKGQISDERKVNKIKRTFIKYLIRMSTRCTPFGLFAGCSHGTFNSNTVLKLDESNKHSRLTRLDMDYLVKLARGLELHPNMQELLAYKVNTSLYKIGNRIRYVESELKENKRQYSLESIELSPELEKLIEQTKKWKRKSEIIELLLKEGMSSRTANELFEELVVNQIIVSDLDPNVSGPDFMDLILNKLKKSKLFKPYFNRLKSITKKMEKLDQNIGNDVQKYREIHSLASYIEPSLNPKYLLQTDLFPRMNESELAHSLVRKIKKGIRILKIISETKIPQGLDAFKDRFIKRFESQSVPLLFALDIESGVGYGQHPTSNYSNDLFEGIEFFDKIDKNDKTSIELNQFQRITIPKIIMAISKNEKEIVLENTELEGIEVDWADAPNTISVHAQIISLGDEARVLLGNCSANAGRLLARFSHGDENIEKLLKDIIQVESELENDCIIAEIIHLPEDRTGNILRRPKLYNYELPYLCNSTLNENNIISPDDLEIRIQNGNIILYSKKHQSRVIPRLTSAHHYRSSHNAVYQFLCDLQFERQGNFGFDWGGLRELFEFLPRLVYEDIIISKAQWKFESRKFPTELNTDSSKIDWLIDWQKKVNISRYISVVQGDNKLCLDLYNQDCLEILLDLIKKTGTLWLEEAFIDRKNQLVSSIDGIYANEIIIPFFKENIAY